MDICITPPTTLSGKIRSIPSKSDLHRSLICASLSDTESTLFLEIDQEGNTDIDPHDLISDDINATINCLVTLGAEISVESSAGGVSVSVKPISFNKYDGSGSETSDCSSEIMLDCGESGSTLRFILPVAAALGRNFSITGHGRLADRPIVELLTEIKSHGCTVDGDKLPLSITGQLKSGYYRIPGDISSQYISGLLLALPLLKGDSHIKVTGNVESASYIQMTMRSLRKYGVEVTWGNRTFSVKGHQIFVAETDVAGIENIENDWSNAAFWLSAGALSNAGITVCGLDTNSVQPDESIIDILRKIGAEINLHNNSEFAEGTIRDIYIKKNVLKNIEFDASRTPDLVPVLSVILSVCPGHSKIYNAGRLRLKESDRLKAIADNLRSIGANIKETKDELEIIGVETLIGGTVNGMNDHRIVMSMAVASIVCENKLVIKGVEAVNKSYKNFFKDFKKLGGNFDVI